MKKQLYILFLFFIVSISACHEDATMSRALLRAEAFMEAHPDSALLILDSIPSPEKHSEEAYATWCLLITQAKDKNYVEHTSDSVINVAVGYFEKQKDWARKAPAYYYRGRVLSDLNTMEDALEAYLNAQNAAQYIDDIKLKARVNNHLGSLYWTNQLFYKSLDCYKTAYSCYKQSGDTVGIVNALRNIGKTFMGIEKPDSALFYLESAVTTLGKGAAASQKEAVLANIGILHEDQGEYARALGYYKEALNAGQNSETKYSRYYGLGEVYYKLNQIDSAFLYARKALDAQDLYIKCSANQLLYQLYAQKQEYPKAFLHNELYLSLSDSIENVYRPQQLAMIETLYNKERLRNKHNQLIQATKARQSLLLIGFLCTCIIFLLLYFNLKKILHRQKEKNDALLNLLAENNKQLTANKNEINKKDTALQAIQQNLTEKQRLTAKQEENIQTLEEDTTKSLEAYQQKLEQMTSETRELIEEKESILKEKACLMHQNKVLLTEQDQKLLALSKESQQYLKQYTSLRHEQELAQNGQEQFKLEMDKLLREKEDLLQQEQKSAKESKAQIGMYKKWQAAILEQNSFLSKLIKKAHPDPFSEEAWEEFMLNFDKVFPDFIGHIKEMYLPTPRDLRICCLVKIGFKVNKIADLLKLETNTVTKLKGEIRKNYFSSDKEHTLDRILRNWY